jgi:hypothetical protein
VTDPVRIDEKKISETMRRGVANGLLGVQLQLSRFLRSTLSKPGTGRLYRVSRGSARGRNLRARGFHRASSPGQPPAVNTGRLRQSWAIAGNADQKFRVRAPLGKKSESTTQEFAVLTYDIAPNRMWFTYGSNLKYARALEFGSRRRGLSQRPYVRPAVAAVGAQALRIVKLWVQRTFAEKA